MNYPDINNREKGDEGEEIAVAFLESAGYSILVRNFRVTRGEIDIIAEDQSRTLVFIEVKSVRDLRFGHPFSKITYGKQKTIAAVARQYLAVNKITNRPCRFDAIGIIAGKVEHLKNAFIMM